MSCIRHLSLVILVGALGFPCAALAFEEIPRQAPLSVWDQSPGYQFRAFEEGNAPAGITDMVESTDGSLWIASSSGLYNFDGRNFDRVPLVDLLGHSGGFITSLAAATDGTLWVGTRSDGIFYTEAGHFRHLGPDEGFNSLSVVSLAIDSVGRVWIGSDTGIFVYDRKKMTHLAGPALIANRMYSLGSGQVLVLTDTEARMFLGLPETSEVLLKGNFVAAAVDPQQRPWLLGSDGTLVVLSAGQPHVVVAHRFSAAASDLAFDENGGVAVLDGGTWNYCASIANVSTGDAIPVTSTQRLSNSEHPSRMIRDQSGQFWIGGARGLVSAYRARQWTIPAASLGLNAPISSFFVDSDGDTWTANAQGVGYVPGAGVHTSPRSVAKVVLAQALAQEPMESVRQDASGRIWFFTRGAKGTMVLEGDQARTFLAPESLGGQFAKAGIIDSLGRAWLVYDGSLVHMQSEGPKAQSIGEGKILAIPKTASPAIVEDREGVVWLFSPRAVLLGFNAKDESLVFSPDGPGQLGIVKESKQIWKDQDGNTFLVLDDAIATLNKSGMRRLEIGAGLGGLQRIVSINSSSVALVGARAIEIYARDSILGKSRALPLRRIANTLGPLGEAEAFFRDSSLLAVSTEGEICDWVLAAPPAYKAGQLAVARAWVDGEPVAAPLSTVSLGENGEVLRLGIAFPAMSPYEEALLKVRLGDGNWTTADSIEPYLPGLHNNDKIAFKAAYFGSETPELSLRVSKGASIQPLVLVASGCAVLALVLGVLLTLLLTRSQRKRLAALEESSSEEAVATQVLRDRYAALEAFALAPSLRDEFVRTGTVRSQARSPVALLGFRIPGFQELSTTVEARAMDEPMAKLHQAIEQALADNGGELIRAEDGVWLACFGPGIDEVEVTDKAALAAEQCLSVLRPVSLPLLLQAAVHTGTLEVHALGFGRPHFHGSDLAQLRALLDVGAPLSLVLSPMAANLIGDKKQLLQHEDKVSTGAPHFLVKYRKDLIGASVPEIEGLLAESRTLEARSPKEAYAMVEKLDLSIVSARLSGRIRSHQARLAYVNGHHHEALYYWRCASFLLGSNPKLRERIERLSARLEG